MLLGRTANQSMAVVNRDDAVPGLEAVARADTAVPQREALAIGEERSDFGERSFAVDISSA
ncbi:MAG: hypothetical protein U0228_21915 [Myxococcaceae bacterium]